MKEYWTEFKAGGISAVGVFGSVALTIFGVILVWIIMAGFAVLNIFNKLAGRPVRPPVPISLSLFAICDTYDYWYDKITTSIKNLVK